MCTKYEMGSDHSNGEPAWETKRGSLISVAQKPIAGQSTGDGLSVGQLDGDGVHDRGASQDCRRDVHVEKGIGLVRSGATRRD
jgi:hypothetical protein